MQNYDRCVKTEAFPDIWMVRERTKSRVKFKTWAEYVEAGEPPFAIISEDELKQYRIASRFRG